MLQPFTGPMRRRIASVNGKISGSINRKENKEDVSRVAAWAVNFDSLLRDKSGLKLFTVRNCIFFGGGRGGGGKRF